MKLVAETGTALERIVTQVAGIKDAVTAIAAGASEQANGLQEINNAIGQMDQITQQNAAMVEESSASSHTLAAEANKLSAYVARFRAGIDTAPAYERQAIAPPRAQRTTPLRKDRTLPAASRTQEPMRKVANGGFVPAPSARASASDNWEEF